MNINLHIDRLVLDGIYIAPGQRRLLQAIITTELTRMINTGGLSSNLVESVSLPRLSTSGIRLTENNPMQLGQQIAKSVYGGIGLE